MKSKSEVLAAGVAVSFVFLLFAVVGFRSTFAAKPASPANTKPSFTVNVGCSESSASSPQVTGRVAPTVPDADCAQALAMLAKKGLDVIFLTPERIDRLSFTINTPPDVTPSYHQEFVEVMTCGGSAYGDWIILGSRGNAATHPNCEQSMSGVRVHTNSRRK